MKFLLVAIQLLIFVITQDNPANPMNYALPLQLPDQNQDGAFLGLHLTRYEISQLFEVCDINRDGKISQVEWSDFYNTFIQPFEEAQIEPRDGLLDADELVAAYQDLEKIKGLFSAEPDKEYLHKVMQTLSSRIKSTLGDEGKLSLNLNEYVFFRRAAVAWTQCTQQKGFISRSSMQSCAQQIMLPNINFSENEQQVFFSAVRQYSRSGEIVSDMFKFLTFLSAFHKYDMFKRISQNKIISGVVNYRELNQACKDSEGPSQKLNLEVLDAIFGKQKANIEFTGLDFKQFYMLMQSVDLVYIHGIKQESFLTPTEFEILMDENVYHRELVNNIDDIKLDIQEELEKPEKKTIWAEQKLLSQQYRRRNMRFKKIYRFSQSDDNNLEKLIPKNIEARNITFNIFDLNQDQLLNPGELFNFHKFAVFFQQLSVGNIHIIYQRNLDINTNVQMKLHQVALFKEEQAQLMDLQRWLRSLNKYNEVAINFIQFASHFYYKHHFRLAGQQAVTSNMVPFPAFVRILMHLGMQLHREDIINAIYYTDKQPQILPAQKFDLEAYTRDGAQVDFEQAWARSTLRWSKSFMRKKFFEPARRRRLF